mgnify:CR=1 FL=1
MKVTLSFSTYIPSTYNNPPADSSSLFCATEVQRSASLPACERTRQWRTPHLALWSDQINVQRAPASAHQHIPEVASLITARTPNLLKTHPYSLGLTIIPILKTIPISPARKPNVHYSDSPDIWLFCFTAQYLCNNTACIQLTAIESLLIKTLTQTDERICSKQELIIGINKDAYNYSGLEMSLSRLQNKFKSMFGERLFRSVRNRGYCLVQDVKVAEKVA